MVLLMSPSHEKGNRRLKENRRFLWIRPRMLHPSKVLPKRNFSSELVESIRRDGVQQPIIVRPSQRGMFEIVDGHLRHKSVQDDPKVLVDVRYSLEDTDVFLISEATFNRKPRNAYERALFYRDWVRAVEAKYGSRGAQAKVAKMADLSEAEVSHYLSISRLFARLQSQKTDEKIFNTLKKQSVNKLYALSKVGDGSVMLEVAAKMSENPKLTLDEIEDAIEDQISGMSQLDPLLEEDGEEDQEEDETRRIHQLKKVAEKLESTLSQTSKTLTIFKSKVTGNPHIFISADTFKRIRKMLNALKRVEKEAKHVMKLAEQDGA